MAETTLTETPTAEILNSFKIPANRRSKPDDILKGLNSTLSLMPLMHDAGEEESARIGLIGGLTREYFAAKMEEEYQPLSPKILELERSLHVKAHVRERAYNGGITEGLKEFYVTLPIFARAVLGKELGWSKKIQKSDYEAQVYSSMPSVPKEIREAGREALAYTHNVYAEALKTPVLGDIVLDRPEHYVNPADAELLVLWKPRPQDLHIEVKEVDRDPILALRNPLGLYLVDVWDEKNEEAYTEDLTSQLEQRTLG